MLVLGRNISESIMVGDDVRIQIIAVSLGGHVKLGVTAPPNVPVHREEVWLKIKEQAEREAGKTIT